MVQKTTSINQRRWYRRHLDETGESYVEHARFALGVALDCAVIAAAIAIHAILPFVLETTGSRRLQALQARIDARQRPGDTRDPDCG